MEKVKRGYEYPLIKFAVITESDIFGQEKKKRKKHRLYEGEKIQSFRDLHVGDYVVHENHGPWHLSWNRENRSR